MSDCNWLWIALTVTNINTYTHPSPTTTTTTTTKQWLTEQPPNALTPPPPSPHLKKERKKEEEKITARKQINAPLAKAFELLVEYPNKNPLAWKYGSYAKRKCLCWELLLYISTADCIKRWTWHAGTQTNRVHFPKDVSWCLQGREKVKQTKNSHANYTHTNKLKQQLQPHNLPRKTVECVYTILHVEVLVQIQYYFTLLCSMFQW